MTFKILYFDGKEISRYMMNQPMAKDYQFKGIFCKRKDRQTKKIKYYLYTEDMETLIMAAEKKQEMRLAYIISMDANKITKESTFYLGIFKQDKKTEFITFSWHPHVDDSKRIMVYLKRHESSSQSRGIGSIKQFNDDILIPILGKAVLLGDGAAIDPIEISEKSLKLIGSTEIITVEDGSSVVNHIIKYDNNVCMSFYQTNEEEFQITVLYPLSLFQAFSMSLSYIE